MTCPQFFRAPTALMALCLMPWSAGLALSPPPDTAARALDQNVQRLKLEALSLGADVANLDKQIRCPVESCVNVYTTVRVSGFLLDEIEITVDDGDPSRYAFNGSESRAMLKSGLHHSLRLNLEPGPHRLRARYSGRFADAAADEAPQTGVLERVFQKNYNELHLVLPVVRDGRRNKAGITEVVAMEAAPSTPGAANRKLPPNTLGFVTGGDSDPRMGVATYLKNDGRYFSALVELLALAAERGPGAEMPVDYEWLLAETMLAFGVYSEADNLYRRLSQRTLEFERLSEAELEMARFSYQRGYLPEAEHVLTRTRARLPERLLGEWRDLTSRTLMAQGRYNEAIEILNALNGSEAQNIYSRYNLGAALMKDGRTDQGRNILDGVGSMPVRDLEDLALRDKANLALGYHFLRREQGGTAKPLFQRVGVEGPHSNRALLGLGWAELAPRGDRQERFALGDEPSDLVPYSTFSTLGVLIRPGYFDANLFARMGLGSFKLGDVSEEESGALMRALVPWVELVKRDRMDAAVQEGMLAIPFALDRLGAHEQALQYYLLAIQTLDDARKELAESIASVRTGRMVETIVRRDLDAELGWKWQLRDLPDLPETWWIRQMLAQYRFQEAVKNYRDVRLLARQMDAWSQQISSIPQELRNRRLSSLPADMLISRAQSTYQPPEGTPTELRMEQQIGGAWLGAGRLRLQGPGPIRLQLSQVPGQFNGPLEALNQIEPRISALRPRIALAGQQQDQQLDELVITDLEAQKTEIERYLLEARFAVARIYDRQLRGEKP